MSRSGQRARLPEDDLPEAVRTLLLELRALREKAGYDLRTLERKSHSSRSSWGRWLSGETWIPQASVRTLAELCGGDRRRLEILWELADQARRTAAAHPPLPRDLAVIVDNNCKITGEEGATPQEGPPAEPMDGGDGESVTASVRARAPGRRWPMSVAIVVCAAAAGCAGVLIGTALRAETRAVSAGTPATAPATVTPTTTVVTPASTIAPAPGSASVPPVKSISRGQVLAHARSWRPGADTRIPYSQTGSYDGYRTDGSGYASMALGLPRPGPTSAGLASDSYSRLITMARLEPGDLVINATGDSAHRQVIVFEKWADAGHTSYWAYQQRRNYGTDRLLLREGLTEDSNFHAYRPRNIQAR